MHNGKQFSHPASYISLSEKLTKTTLVTSLAHGLSNSIFGMSTYSLYLWKYVN